MKTLKYSTRRIKQEKVKTTDDTNPYPRVDLRPFTPRPRYKKPLIVSQRFRAQPVSDPERQFVVDHATVMNESVLDINFSHADVMDYYIFACVILKLHQNLMLLAGFDQAEQTVSALKDDTSVVSPGFFLKATGTPRSAHSPAAQLCMDQPPTFFL